SVPDTRTFRPLPTRNRDRLTIQGTASLSRDSSKPGLRTARQLVNTTLMNLDNGAGGLAAHPSSLPRTPRTTYDCSPGRRHHADATRLRARCRRGIAASLHAARYPARLVGDIRRHGAAQCRPADA